MIYEYIWQENFSNFKGDNLGFFLFFFSPLFFQGNVMWLLEKCQKAGLVPLHTWSIITSMFMVAILNMAIQTQFIDLICKLSNGRSCWQIIKDYCQAQGTNKHHGSIKISKFFALCINLSVVLSKSIET